MTCCHFTSVARQHKESQLHVGEFVARPGGFPHPLATYIWHHYTVTAKWYKSMSLVHVLLKQAARGAAESSPTVSPSSSCTRSAILPVCGWIPRLPSKTQLCYGLSRTNNHCADIWMDEINFVRLPLWGSDAAVLKKSRFSPNGINTQMLCCQFLFVHATYELYWHYWASTFQWTKVVFWKHSLAF